MEVSKVEVTDKARRRFAKDSGVPIKVYNDPYFTSRLELYDRDYNSVELYNLFLEMYVDLGGYEGYTKYMSTQLNAIEDYIRNDECYKCFSESISRDSKYDNRYAGKFPKGDVYKPSNDGRKFISIDIRQGNYTALLEAYPSMFGGIATYEEFIGKWFEYTYIKKAKHLRQVVLGKHSAKGQRRVIAYLVGELLSKLLKVIPESAVEVLNVDEIVLDYDKVVEHTSIEYLEDIVAKERVKYRLDVYTLAYDVETEGYTLTYADGRVGYKGVDSRLLPVLVRKTKGEAIRDEDITYVDNGWVCRLVRKVKI